MPGQYGIVLGAILLCTGATPGFAAAGPIPLDVSLGDVSLNKVAFLIAADTGIYARNGLEVHQFITPAAAQVARNSGVVVPKEYIRAGGGNAPIDIGGGSPMIYRVANDARGVHRVALASTETYIRDHVIASAEVKSVEDLKGRRLGYSVPGAVTHVGALSFVKHMGWDANKDISLMGNGNALNPLREGREDALLGSAMLFAMAPELKLKDLIDLTPFKFPVAGSSILAETSWLVGNHDTAARFVKSTVEAIALMKTDSKAFNAALAKWFAITDATTQQRMFHEADDIPAKPYPAVEGIKVTMALYDSPEMRKYKAEDFYDASFIAELDKSGAIDRLYK